MLSISSANLFAIGITIDIAIGFTFLSFFMLGVGQAPKDEKTQKDKPMAMSTVMPMAKDLHYLYLARRRELARKKNASP